MSFGEIEMKVKDAIDKFWREDSDLMQYEDRSHRLPERAISHRFAMYLEPPLAGCKIDCDYNKFEQGIKRPDNEPEKWFAPDIVMHKRKDASLNLLAMELKAVRDDAELRARGDEVQKDNRSLIELTKLGKFAYTFGAFLLFIGGETKITWYKTGIIRTAEELRVENQSSGSYSLDGV